MSLLMGHICISTYGVLERTLLSTEGSAALPSFQSLKTDDINVPPCLDRITLGFRINFILRLLCIPMSNSNDKMRLENRRKNRSFNSYFFLKTTNFMGCLPLAVTTHFCLTRGCPTILQCFVSMRLCLSMLFILSILGVGFIHLIRWSGRYK